MRRAIGLIVAVSLAGCATAYKPKGFSGGFSETQLSENVFRVRFNGNGYTSAERASDLALLRSAQLTKEKGFSFFVLADEQQSFSHSAFTTPTNTTTTGQASMTGNTVNGTFSSTSSGGQVVNIYKPRAANVVVMYHERPAVAQLVYDAAFICQSVGAKYKAPC